MREPSDPVSILLRLAGDPIRPDPGASERARDRARTAWREGLRARRRRRWIGGLAALAASVAIAAGLGLLPIRDAAPPSPDSDPAPIETAAGQNRTARADEPETETAAVTESGRSLRPGSVVETPAHGGAALVLENGCVIDLAPSSRLRLAEVGRLELENGGLTFDSTPGEVGRDHRVALWTPLATIVNLGTRYDVRIDASGLELTVHSGRVRVQPVDGPSRTVDAGDSLRLQRASPEVSSPSGPPSRRPFDIDGRTVGEFLDWVARESGLEVRLGAGVGRELLAVRLRGDLTWTDPVEALGPTLALAGASVRIEGDVAVVED